MAPVLKVLRTCGLTLYFVLWVLASPETGVEPSITSVEISSKKCVQNNCKYLLDVRGSEFLGHHSWRLTPSSGVKGASCDKIYPNYELIEVKTSQFLTTLEITVPYVEGKIYFCLQRKNVKNSPFGGEWVHQGEDWILDPLRDSVHLKTTELSTTESLDIQKANLQDTKEWADLSHDIDVNQLPNINRPTREESKDIELLVNDKYVPLNELNEPDANDYNDIQVIDNPNFVLDKRYVSNNDVVNAFNDNVRSNIGVVVGRRKKRGTNMLFKELNAVNDIKVKQVESLIRTERQAVDDFTSVKAVDQTGAPAEVNVVNVVIEGLRVEESNKEPKITDEGIPSVLADSAVTIRVFGEGLTPRTVIAFTNYAQEYGQQCKFLLKGEYMAKEGSVTRKSALFEVTAPPPITGSKLYVCTKNLKPGIEDLSKDEEQYTHQGTESFKTLATHNALLPLWVALILIMTCLMFSALFSGLNLGLMSLDRTELKIIANTGTEQERKYARAIMPVRDHGNYLLCSILLGNVAVNSTFTILLDELTSGLFAVIFSTLSIVLFGEITPQAICSRHGLMVGAKSIMVTKAVMALTAPLAFPVSKLLDYFLGEEIGSVYNRERLKELVKVTTDVNDLDKDEVNIISGALELRKKTVSDIMTKLEDVFMLPVSSVLDFETMSEIVKSGYSRIPVYEGSRGNIVTVLFIKDLAFVDPDDNTPLRTLCQYYQNPCNFVFEDVTLDVMFKQFKDGHKGHMAFVHRINNEGEGDPFYETIGLVTLEDVIEEMIQAEIVDETDVFLDNRTKKRRNKPLNKLQDFGAFAERHENQRIHISPQLTLATFQFLSTSVDAFRPDTVSETVLRRLLRQDVIQNIKVKGKTKKDPSTFVFQQGKPVDYFVLILEGRVEVTVGRENLVFEAGPFTYFGVQALTQNIGVAESPTPSAMGSLQNINVDAMLRHTFVPDYSVRAITELFYLTVKRSLYLAAKRATLMEKGAMSKGATHEQFDTEVDKHLCYASSANIPIAMISKKLLGKSTSTASTNDNLGSTSTCNKPIIHNMKELMQIAQPFAASDQSECEKFSRTTNPSKSNAKSANYLPIVAKSACDTKQVLINDGKCLAQSWSSPQEFLNAERQLNQGFYSKEAKLLNKNQDFLEMSNLKQNSKDFFTIESKLRRLEDNTEVCDECVRNNYWMTKTNVYNNKTELKINDTETINKKKKTTFHADSSLLTFYDFSPNETDSPLDDPEEHNECARCSSDDRDVCEQEALLEGARRSEVEKEVLAQLSKILLQSVDEDLSITGEQKTPSRQVSPNPPPVSASPHTRATFASRSSPEHRNGDLYPARLEEQEKLLKHT